MFPRYLMKTLMSEYNWLQGSVATYLRCDGVVNNQIKKGLLLSLPVKNNKSVNIWQGYMQEGGCLRLVLFLRLLLMWWPGESAPPRDARIAFFNICILSVSIKNYPYPIRSDVDNWYPYPWFYYGTIWHRQSPTLFVSGVPIWTRLACST